MSYSKGLENFGARVCISFFELELILHQVVESFQLSHEPTLHATKYVDVDLASQGFFLCKTKKPRSEIWKTQIAKFSENPVLSHKTQFKFFQNPPFPKIFQKNH